MDATFTTMCDAWLATIDCETAEPNAFPQRLRVRAHELRADVGPATGSTDSAPGPHDYFDASLVARKTLTANSAALVPMDDEHEERAFYVVEGAIECDGRTFLPGTLVILRPAAKVTVGCGVPSRAMFLGAARLVGERHIWWNFVSSSEKRIERAKETGRAGAFPPFQATTWSSFRCLSVSCQYEARLRSEEWLPRLHGSF